MQHFLFLVNVHPMEAVLFWSCSSFSLAVYNVNRWCHFRACRKCLVKEAEKCEKLTQFIVANTTVEKDFFQTAVSEETGLF